jgi:hypothetical protein
MLNGLLFRVRIAAGGLVLASLASVALADDAAGNSSESPHRAAILTLRQLAIPTQQSRPGMGPDIARQFYGATTNAFPETSVGDLLIGHFFGLDEEVSSATPSVRMRPTLRRDQIGVRLQIRF